MIGFTATGGQIIVLREFIIVFYGNELCLGVILANWLLWGAVGSWALGRFADRIRRRIGLLASCEIFLAILLPAMVFAIRSARVILKVQPGVLIGFVHTYVFTLLVLAPLCAILGLLFALGARMYPTSKGAKQIGYVYILEGVGASVGGLLTSLLMIRYLNSVQTIMIIGALNLAAAASLKTFAGKGKAVKVFFRGVIAVLLVINIYLLIPESAGFLSFLDPLKADRLNFDSLVVQWGTLGLKESRNSIYSNLTVVGGKSGYSFFSNGLLIFTVPNLAAAEQVAHFPMLEHPDPRKVLLIGGGVGGSLGEILKHPVKEVDYVELDPMVIELAHKWLDARDLVPLNDPRVKVANIDGRLFVKRADRKYDVIIVDLPEPFTAQLNRFYTEEFFREVKGVLSDRGLFSLGVVSSANYISGEHQKFLNCVFRTLESVFPDIITIPAEDQMLFMACKTEGMLTYDRETLSARLRERRIESLFVSEYQMPVWLEPWRVKTFSERIRKQQDVSINRDFLPVSYYYDMILWAAQFTAESRIESIYKDIFKTFVRFNLWWFLLPAFVIGVALFCVGNWKERVRREYILVAITVMGFVQIAFEVVISLAFQIIYGYMYYKVGLILTAFMIGLIIGSVLAMRIMDKLKDDLRVFIIAQAIICVYPLILLGVFYAFKGGGAYFVGTNVIFPIMPVIAGVIGGFQFPLATKIYLKYKTRVGQVAGLTYGIDLAGSCAGAFLVSTFLVPIIGIPNTCFAIVLLGLIALVLLGQGYFRQ